MEDKRRDLSFVTAWLISVYVFNKHAMRTNEILTSF